MDPNDNPDPLMDAAIRLTDGQPVDWGELSSDLDVSQRNLAARLGELERLAHAFRGESENVGGGADGDGAGDGDSGAEDGAEDGDGDGDEDEDEDGDGDTPRRNTGVDGAPAETAPVKLSETTPAPPDSEFLFTWGPLWVLESLGEGGYGEVYRAFDPRLQRDVALKLLREDAAIGQDDLLAEARRLAQLRHPNIVTVHGVDAHEDRVGVWFERLEGRDLAAIVREAEPMDTAIAIDHVLAISNAVRAVHDAGWIHGDVKAGNVVLEPGGRPVLIDFGSGRASTTSGFTSGTPLILPPEAFEGATVGTEGDVYALGVLLFHLLTGSYPVIGADLEALEAAHEVASPRRVSELRAEVPSATDVLLTRALAPDPDSRFSKIADWIQALESCRDRLADLRGALISTEEPETESKGDDTPPNNLPIPEFSFVGRETELTEITEHAKTHRIVTLIGPGGAGKTRLALEWASRTSGNYPHGVAWVDLSAVRERDRIAQVVASTLGLTDTAREELSQRIREHLEERHTLLVLDNCEHVRDACTEFLAEAVPESGDSFVLATSREALKLPAETTFLVPPLGLPQDDSAHPEQLIEHESIELLVRRFRDVDPSFRLDTARAAPVARIARQLDGLPLALELAAGRLRILPVDQIADRLDDRFRLLTGGRARHQTLRAMVDWSYEALSREEQTLLNRLSVFAGGWTVAAMEAVCADAGADAGSDAGGDAGTDPDTTDTLPTGLTESSLLDLLSSLREKFLVARAPNPDGHGSRLHLLETLRVYAREKLTDSKQRDQFEMRHAHYFRDEMARVYPMLKGDEQPEGLSRIAAEHENHLLTVDTFLDRATRTARAQESDTNARDAWLMADGFGLYWWVRGHWGEADRVLRRVLDLPAPETPTKERIQAQLWRGHFCSNRGETESARAVLDAALDGAIQLGKRGLIGRALSYRGQLAYAEGQYDDAVEIMERALAVHESRGDSRAMAIALASIGNAAEMQGDIDTARERFERSLELARKSSDTQNVGYALQRLAAIAIVQEQIDPAERYALEAIPIVESLGNAWGQANTFTLLGDVYFHRGDRAKAAEHFRKTVTLYDELGDSGSALRAEVRLGFLSAEDRNTTEAIRWFRSSLVRAETISNFRDVIGIAQGLADVAHQLGEPELSARLYGAGEGMAARHGVQLWNEERTNLERARALLLGDGAAPSVQAAWEQGLELSDPEIAALCRTVG